MSGLTQRSLAEEQMDAADLPEDTYAAVLADLAQVNALTMAARPTLAFLERIAALGRSLKVLDVGFGHGRSLPGARRCEPSVTVLAGGVIVGLGASMAFL